MVLERKIQDYHRKKTINNHSFLILKTNTITSNMARTRRTSRSDTYRPTKKNRSDRESLEARRICATEDVSTDNEEESSIDSNNPGKMPAVNTAVLAATSVVARSDETSLKVTAPLPPSIPRDIDRGSVSSVASHQNVHHEGQRAAAVPKGTNMYKSDMPFTVTSSYPTPGMMKTIKDTVRNILFPNCKFYRNADDANSLTGLVLHELGYSGNSETAKYMRVKSWAAVREVVMTTTAEARQAVIVRWYKASNGTCDLFVFHASSYVLLT